MSIKLKIWRQKDQDLKGHFKEYVTSGTREHMSLLEIFDLPSEQLFAEGKEPVAFGPDYHEGICSQCDMVIDGQARGPIHSTTCQPRMRHLVEDPSFKDDSTITTKPWRSTGSPTLRDLIVGRSALSRIVQADDCTSVNTGGTLEAHSMSVQKEKADAAFETATCISCGVYVAACPSASAMLLTGVKTSHLGLLLRGQPERLARVMSIFNQHDTESFGSCTNISEYVAVYPKSVPLEIILRLNRDLGHTLWKGQHTY